jgi:hypothetical protein
MLTRAHRQEALCRAYIHAVAGHCGLTCSFRDFDYGIDMTVHHIKVVEGRRSETGYRLDIQAKASTSAMLTADSVVHDLETRAYNDLREEAGDVPRILVLLSMPDAEGEWLGFEEGGLLLRRCAYWVSLRGRPPTSNTDSVRITIPRVNVFSPAGLAALMVKVRVGEPL